MAGPSKSLARDDDVARLPQWAQDQVRNLLRENARLKEQLSEDGPPDSDTFVDGVVDHPDRPLGRRPTINFGRVPISYRDGTEGFRPAFQVRWYADEEVLHVSTYQGRAVILPEVTNAFRVRFEQP